MLAVTIVARNDCKRRQQLQVLQRGRNRILGHDHRDRDVFDDGGNFINALLFFHGMGIMTFNGEEERNCASVLVVRLLIEEEANKRIRERMA